MLWEDFRSTSSLFPRNVTKMARCKPSILNISSFELEGCKYVIRFYCSLQNHRVSQQCSNPVCLWKLVIHLPRRKATTTKYVYNTNENTKQKENYHSILHTRSILQDSSINTAHDALIFPNKLTQNIYGCIREAKKVNLKWRREIGEVVN